MKKGTRHLLEKAERAIQAAEILLTTVGAEFAAGRAYLMMTYARPIDDRLRAATEGCEPL